MKDEDWNNLSMAFFWFLVGVVGFAYLYFISPKIAEKENNIVKTECKSSGKSHHDKQ
jgi:hypothetical protein